MNRKKVFFVGLLGLGVTALLMSQSREADAAPAPEPDLPPPDEEDEAELEVVLGDLEEVSPGLPGVDDIADQPVVVAPLPDGVDAIEDAQDVLDDVLEKAKGRVVVDDGDAVSPGLDLPDEAPDSVLDDLPLPPVPIDGLEPPELDTGEEVELPDPDPLAPETAELIRVLLGKEARVDWKAKEPVVTAWQRKRGLTADGMFGPGSALALAQETGLLPIVRFWPRAAVQSRAVPDYQRAVVEVAATAEQPRRAHLMAAAEREQGQGFGTPPKPITTRVVL